MSCNTITRALTYCIVIMFVKFRELGKVDLLLNVILGFNLTVRRAGLAKTFPNLFLTITRANFSINNELSRDQNSFAYNFPERTFILIWCYEISVWYSQFLKFSIIHSISSNSILLTTQPIFNKNLHVKSIKSAFKP